MDPTGTWDVVVVGAGPAGVAAACQAMRDGLAAAVVEGSRVGGSLWAAGRITNGPGLGPVTGPALAARFHEALQMCGARLVASQAVSLSRGPGGSLRVGLSQGGHLAARAVILATGLRPKQWTVSGWEEAVATGLGHRDLRTMPEDLSGKRVVVVGGGDVALDTCLGVLARNGRSVLWHRSPTLKPAPILVEAARHAGVEFVWSGEVLAVSPVQGPGVELIAERTRTTADLVVVCVGREPDLRLLAGIEPWSHSAREDPQCGPKGIFLAGDVAADVGQRFVGWAIGSGQRAARMALAWLREDESG